MSEGGMREGGMREGGMREGGMSEEAAVKTRGRRSRAEVERLMAEFEASGLTRQQFCVKYGLAVARLDRYRRRHQQKRSGKEHRFLQVELTGARPAEQSNGASALSVVLSSGRRIEVGRGFDGPTLERLVSLLEKV